MIVTSDFYDNFIFVLQQERLESNLVFIFCPVICNVGAPPALSLINVHHDDKLLVLTCIFQLFCEPLDLASNLSRFVLVVILVNGKTIEAEQGKSVFNQRRPIPTTLLDGWSDSREIKIFIARVICEPRIIPELIESILV